MSLYRCHACSTEFAAWAATERHADVERHHRIELILAPTNQQGGRMPKQGIRRDRRDGERRMGQPRPNRAPVEAPPPAPAATPKRTDRHRQTT